MINNNIINLNDVSVIYLNHCTSLKSLYEKVKEYFKQDKVELTIHYGDNLETAKKLEEKLMDDLNVKKITVTPLTPVLGVHTGPKMIAIVGRRV